MPSARKKPLSTPSRSWMPSLSVGRPYWSLIMATSFEPDVGFAHGGAPLHELLLDEAAEIFRRPGHRHGAPRDHRVLHFRVAERAAIGRVQLVDDRPGRARRREDRIPRTHVEALEALRIERRDLGRRFFRR